MVSALPHRSGSKDGAELSVKGLAQCRGLGGLADGDGLPGQSSASDPRTLTLAGRAPPSTCRENPSGLA